MDEFPSAVRVVLEIVGPTELGFLARAKEKLLSTQAALYPIFLLQLLAALTDPELQQYDKKLRDVLTIIYEACPACNVSPEFLKLDTALRRSGI
jgi:hypothetical protein